MNKYNTNRVSHNRGAAIITVVMFFVIITLAMAVGLSAPVVREYKTSRDFEKSKGAYYLSESGNEDAIYRIRKGSPITAQEILRLGGNTATTTITDVNANKKAISSIGDIWRNTRRVKSALSTTIGAAFNYGVQVGTGGLYMRNTSSITGNVYSAGPVCGGASIGTDAICSGVTGTNIVSGVVISGGTTGSNGIISNVVNQGVSSMYAGTIMNSVVAGAPHCTTISGTTPGICQSLSPQTAAAFPLSAADIASLEAAATAGGINNCGGQDKIFITTTQNLGPQKYTCDLYIRGPNITLTLKGPIWATGKIFIKNFVTLQVDPTLVGQSVAMIADNPTDLLQGSFINVEDNTITFTGAPGGNSWVMLLSENNGASRNGDIPAIDLQDGATGALILYARLGEISIANNSSVNTVTGYKLTLKNAANVIYSSGLPNALFNLGPTGAWSIQDWKEGQ